MGTTEDANSLYVREGAHFVPTGLGASPWNPEAQSGAVIAALTGQLFADMPARAPMSPVRLTIDLFGAVPMEPLEARTRILRDGRRMQLAELELFSGDRTWVRASMLRMRIEGPGQDRVPLTRPFPDSGGVHRVLSEIIRVEGDPETPGPGALWVRMLKPVIEGEELAPLACVAMAADYGTFISPPAPLRQWTFANLDISIHLTRLPVGDWLLLDGISESAGNGTGVGTLSIGDREGMLGMSHQSLFIAPR